jgi:heat shock protein HslJ
VEDERLTLTTESDRTLVFAPAPPPRLDGVTWEVTGFHDGRDAVVSPAVGTTLTLRFEGGFVTGQAGCNAYRAPYAQKDDSLEVGAIVATKKACADDGVLEQERRFLAALAAARVWAIHRGMLDMPRADGARALTARAETEPSR